MFYWQRTGNKNTPLETLFFALQAGIFTEQLGENFFE
jgi:hypothetical protein